MAVDWSTSAAPVLVELRRDTGVPLRAQLEGQLREAIQSGRLGADERVPSSRSLAEQLGISRGLVQECYSQLLAEGYLVSRGGSATRVAALHPGAPRPAAAPVAVAPRLRVSFATGVPDLGMMPRDDWAKAVREACQTVPNALLDYGEPAGDLHLREVVAAYLRRVRAAATSASDIVICAGFQQGLALVLEALAASGATRVAHEDPGSGRTIRRAADAARLESVPVAVDDDGIRVDALEATGAQAVVVAPAHQWPTGVVLSPGRRRQLLDWATRTGGVVIEDEYDAEFRYDREPIGSLQGLAPDHVVILGTVSKSLAPALRLGWAVIPQHLVPGVTAAKLVADRGNPALDQRALAILIESGRYDRHLRRMRTEYGRRRQALVAAVERHAPAVRVTGLSAGIHAVLHLPAAVDEASLVARARAAGLGVDAMGVYHASGRSSSPQLVLGFGNTPVEKIDEGIAILAEVLAAAQANRPMESATDRTS